MNTFSNQLLSQPQSSIISNSITITKNIILLKNQSLQPQIIKINLHQSLTIKIAHNNSYALSQINNYKKYIFAIEQLDQQSSPISQGQSFQFDTKIFNQIGQFKIVCINMPKVQAKIIVQKNNSQSADQLFDSFVDININNLNLLNNQQQLSLKTPIKLAQVKQQQPEQQNMRQQKQQTIGLSNSKSDLQQYERILTQQDDKYSDSLENKYIKYFKQQFKLWRNFFEQQQQKQKKQSLKSKHTKNLSLSQVKQIDPKHKSQYQSDQDSGSQNNSSSMGKGVSIASHLYSHQQILDRNNDQDINSGRKQMKKTNSQYGFNIMRSQQQKQPTLDKISVFGKQQQQINLPSNTIHHSRRSNHQSSSKPQTNTNQKKKSSRISMSRTQTNSPALRQYSKKQNNFVTWAIQWAKQKQYKPVIIQKKNDNHIIKQFDTYMKNRFKIAQFLYC